ncbi:STIMATE family protein [Skeletonema marinoi]|uniref:STIMATE family protein n=1 Tax=Skeletonema marinoi TaxID=267567 RepID=A0AAD8XS82_9STRA|nr:STIMATE family protein [Skeletonema marinoi]|mmetsp:Transcript_9363/g.16009  ORF Transcript_9363/g.16009 Transcript_9363/m.16009 type:complete len:282 (-) Transcript_9363:278-1123(-)
MANDDYYAEAVEAEPVCQIYSKEDTFTSFVQGLLAAFALASLWVKRQQEKPRRKFLTWFLDVSKQAFGACYAHVLNMIISAIIAENAMGGDTLDDECAWYAINYVIDTTLGLVITIIFLDWLEKMAKYFNWTSLKNSGVYVGREGIMHWAMQMMAWIIILTLVKVIICVVMWLTSAPLAYIGAILFLPLQSNIRFELLFVMIFFPGVLNIIYFWITDSYLKAGGHQEGCHEGDELKELPPVNKDEETAAVTPYAEMGSTSADELAGNKDVATYGSTTRPFV